jgi:hypothetical protein
METMKIVKFNEKDYKNGNNPMFNIWIDENDIVSLYIDGTIAWNNIEQENKQILKYVPNFILLEWAIEVTEK